MRKGSGSADDKWNISVVNCDTAIPYQLTKSWWRPYNFRSDNFILANRYPWFSSFLVSSNPLSRKSRNESHVFCVVFKACGETVLNFMFVTVHIFKVANSSLVFKCIVRDGSIYLCRLCILLGGIWP